MAVRLKGHEVRTAKHGGRWIAHCSCGYTSATRTSEDIAAGAALHHVMKIVGEYRRNGLTPPLVNAS
jgi:hypothetical protein